MFCMTGFGLVWIPSCLKVVLSAYTLIRIPNFQTVLSVVRPLMTVNGVSANKWSSLDLGSQRLIHQQNDAPFQLKALCYGRGLLLCGNIILGQQSDLFL